MTHPAEQAWTLLVGHARDRSSDHALRVAVDLGCRLGARLHVVHTVCLDPYPYPSRRASSGRGRTE